MNIKSLVALGLAVLLFLTPVASATAAPVSEGAVGQAAEAGLIPAGFLVKEDATITRAEFLDLTDRLYTALQTAPVPVDPGNAGEAVTLQEASAILVELIDAAFGDADVGLYTETVFDDNWQLSGEYRPAVNYLYHYGVIGTPGVYKIYPQQKLTVRQAADLVYKIYAAGNAGKFNMATAISEEWEWHIDPVYDGLGPNTKFSGGLAAVSLEGKYGYIDRFGIPVIPFQYDRGYDFSEGLAKVSQGGKVGYINKQGTVVIPLQYDDGGDFSEGRVWLKQDGKYGFADDRGIVLIPLQYEYAYPFRESLAPVKENGRYGYIDPWGKTVIPFQYTWASSFSEGLARTGSKGEYNYIDKTGQIALQLNYDYLFDFADGRAIVFNRDQYGVIDKSGNFLIPFGRWGLIYGFRNGLSVAHGNSGYEGNHSFINTGGDVVIGSQPFYDAEGFSEGLGTVASHNKVTDQVTRSYITRNGELILPKRTDIKSVSPYDANAFYLQAFSEGLAAVVTAEGKLGFIQNPLFKRPVEGAAVLEGSSQAAAGAGYDLTYGLRMAKNVSAQQIFLTYDRDLLDLQNPVVLSGGTEIVQTKEVAPGQVRYLLASLGSSHQLESRVEVVKFHFITKQQVVSGKYTASVSAVLADEKGNERTAGPVWNAIPAASIAVTGEGGATGISAKGGTLQLLAEVLPGNADNRAVAWTLHNEDGTVTDKAVISASGLVTAVKNGTVKATATAEDGSGVSGSLVVTVSGQDDEGPEEPDPVPVASIAVTGEGGAAAISVKGGTLQLLAEVLPGNADNRAVAWTLHNEDGTVTDKAVISASGLVTAVKNGTVKAAATAEDGSGVSGSLVITVSGQGTVFIPSPPSGNPGSSNTASHDLGSVALTEMSVVVTINSAKLDELIKKPEKTVKIALSGNDKKQLAVDIPVSSLSALVHAGKSLEVSTGEAVITIPAGSLNLDGASGNIRIRVTRQGKPVVAQAGLVPLTDAVSLEITAGTKKLLLQAPIEIGLKPDTDGHDLRKAGIYLLNAESGNWEYLFGTAGQNGLVLRTSGNGDDMVYGAFIYNKTFRDVGAAHWARDYVEVLASRHIIDGVDSARFNPLGTITRAEFAAMAVRLLQLPAAGKPPAFVDAAEGAWYEDEIAAAVQAGILQGDGTGVRPEEFISRQEMAVIAVRILKSFGYSTDASASTATAEYADQAEIADWAKDAVAAAQGFGIMNGQPGNSFVPLNSANRAEAAAVLFRLLDKIGQL